MATYIALPDDVHFHVTDAPDTPNRLWVKVTSPEKIVLGGSYVNNTTQDNIAESRQDLNIYRFETRPKIAVFCEDLNRWVEETEWITFYIDGNEYKAIEGMTWSNFCDHWGIKHYILVTGSNGNHVSYGPDARLIVNQTGNTEIIDGYEYVTEDGSAI